MQLHASLDKISYEKNYRYIVFVKFCVRRV